MVNKGAHLGPFFIIRANHFFPLILQKIGYLKRIKPSIVPGILWFIAATILLTLPGSALEQKDWLSEILDRIWFDKWVHIGLFAILVFLWCWAILRKYPREKRKSIFIMITLMGLAYGLGMEFVQKYFIADRSFDIKDIAADAAGCGLGLVYSISRYIKK